MNRKANEPHGERKIGKVKMTVDFITITGKIVGLNIGGDGINQNSAQLQVRFKMARSKPMPLHVYARAAPQFFQSVCSMASYAYEKECDVTVTYFVEGDHKCLVYLQLPNKA